jgi:hypothetical protein
VITIDVWLYGPLAQYGDDRKKSYANPQVELPEGSCIRDLLDVLSVPTEKRGITFVNGDLSAMPGLQPDLDHVLHDGDRVAFFHLQSMWPYQYRHGAGQTPALARAMQAKGKLFHQKSDT